MMPHSVYHKTGRLKAPFKECGPFSNFQLQGVARAAPVTHSRLSTLELENYEVAPKTHELAQERLKELLDYDPQTGIFTRRISTGDHGRWKAGSVAGAKQRSKHRRTTYVKIMIDGVSHTAHQLAWLYVYGGRAPELNHRNEVGTDNRIANLRLSTSSQSKANVSRRLDNSSGFKGVCASGSRWRACIRKDRKRINLGTFDTPEEAHAAYCEATKRLFGEFANPG